MTKSNQAAFQYLSWHRIQEATRDVYRTVVVWVDKTVNAKDVEILLVLLLHVLLVGPTILSWLKGRLTSRQPSCTESTNRFQIRSLYCLLVAQHRSWCKSKRAQGSMIQQSRKFTTACNTSHAVRTVAWCAKSKKKWYECSQSCYSLCLAWQSNPGAFRTHGHSDAHLYQYAETWSLVTD